MNDFGLTLAWLMVQVTILLAPALAVHALASRRGPAPGAWVATLSFGLVVALNVAAFVPRINRKGTERMIAPTTMSHAECDRIGYPATLRRPSRWPPDAIHTVAGRGRGLAWLRLAWDRSGAVPPSRRCGSGPGGALWPPLR